MICNHREPRNLNQHLKQAHGLKTTEYKKQYPGARTMTGHSKRTIDYWMLLGYDEESALQQVKGLQTQSKVRFVQKHLQQGLTQEEVQQKWNKQQAENSPRSVQYWLSRGYSPQDAAQEVAKLQSMYSKRSKKFSGKKHTSISRLQISKTMQEHIQKIGTEEWVSHFYSGQVGSRSKGEIECYEELSKLVPGLVANKMIGPFIVDMIVGDKILEYNGDFWHANPAVYQQEELPIIGNTEKVREKDRKRLQKLEDMGFSTYLIWESSWRNNKEQEIQNILNFTGYANADKNKD